MTNATEQAGQKDGLAGQASTTVHDAASSAQEKVSELREQGSERLRDQFDQRSSRAGSQVRSLGDALRRSGNDLGSEGNGSAARLTGAAADRIERIGSYLEQKRGDELMGDIEAFARRRPWMLAGLGMLAGVAGARFMKASSEQRYGGAAPSRQQWQTRQGIDTGRSRPYELASDVPAASSDDPLARPPHAGTR